MEGSQVLVWRRWPRVAPVLVVGALGLSEERREVGAESAAGTRPDEEAEGRFGRSLLASSLEPGAEEKVVAAEEKDVGAVEVRLVEGRCEVVGRVDGCVTVGL